MAKRAALGAAAPPATKDQREIIDDDFSKRCAALANLPKDVDLERFKKSLIFAATAYRTAKESDPNRVHHEIASLYRAAHKPDPRATAKALDCLSVEARHLIEKRQRNSEKLPHIPTAGEFEGQDAAKACDAVEALCSYGGRWITGRKRPNGKRSRTWKPILVAPDLVERPKQRGPERTLIIWLQLAVEEALGRRGDGSVGVSTTVSLERPGPLVRVAMHVLKAIGEGHVANKSSVVNAINTLAAERRAALSEGMLETGPQGLSGPNR